MTTEQRERMRGLVNTKAMKRFEENLKTIIQNLKEEGFDEEEVKEYLQGSVHAEVLYRYL